MNYRAIAKEIGKGNFRPIYICYGPETYLMQEFIHYLTEQWIAPEDRDFAVSKFDLAETNVSEVIDDAATLPFVGSRKLIIAKDAAFFTGAKDSSKIEHRLDQLMDYIQSPAEFSIIVFTVSADKLDERKKIVKSISQAQGAVPFPAMTADDLSHWVRRQTDRLRLKLAGDADQTLIMNCGGNLQMMAGELQKLSLYAGEGGTVDTQTVDRLVSRTTEQNVFRMIDEMVRLRLGQALEIYYELLKHREEPIKILALMARQFRNMLLIKQLAEQGMPQGQIASTLSMSPYAVKINADQARAFSAARLQDAMCDLADIDYKMKTGQIDKAMALELFMLQLSPA